MSATFRLSKKKVSQDDLRRLMTDHKEKLQLQRVTKRIDSPLAKYNDIGQLTCALCKTIVRSEGVWNVHINTKQHKENIDYAKKLKAHTKNFTSTRAPVTTLKRPASPPSGSSKKIKGILKNSTSSIAVPADFFDLNNGAVNKNTDSSQTEVVPKHEHNENLQTISNDGKTFYS